MGLNVVVDVVVVGTVPVMGGAGINECKYIIAGFKPNEKDKTR
jgi:hypothetical protein